MTPREWIAWALLRWGLRLITDRGAYWFFQVQRDYWTGERGRAILQRFATEDKYRA